MKVWPRLRLRAIVTALVAVAFVLGSAPSAGAAVILPPGSIPVPSSGTFLYMNSEPGDYIGQGIEQLYTSDDSTIRGSFSQDGGGFFASVIQGNYDHWWYVDFAAPPGEPLVEGSYTGALRYPFNDGAPGLSVSGDGRGCNTLTGQFDVNEISQASTGELLVFDATFEQHCEGGDPALYGRIRIENPPPPPDVTPPTLNLPGEITVEATDASGTNVSYSATASDDRDPNPTVTCTPSSGSFFPVGTTTVNCQATDASGNVATGSFLVHVYAPLQLAVTVNSQGTVSPQTGVAAISGTVTCSRPISVNLGGTLKQLFAKRVTISGAFSTQVDCTAPSTGWSATVTGDNGRFGAGSADVTVNAFGCELSCHSDSVASTIRLRGEK
jgi:HYR domain